MAYSETSDKGHSERAEQRTTQKYPSSIHSIQNNLHRGQPLYKGQKLKLYFAQKHTILLA